LLNTPDKHLEVNDNIFITSDDVIKILHIPKSTLDVLCHQKRIPFYKPAKRRLFIKSEIIEWVKESRFEGRNKRKLDNDL
ncbi:hypothetical protein DRQ09_02370, partial [candidate division KSB1 bacterium]